MTDEQFLEQARPLLESPVYWPSWVVQGKSYCLYFHEGQYAEAGIHIESGAIIPHRFVCFYEAACLVSEHLRVWLRDKGIYVGPMRLVNGKIWWGWMCRADDGKDALLDQARYPDYRDALLLAVRAELGKG